MNWREGFRTARKLTGREVACHLVRPTHALFFITYRCSSRCTTCTMWRRGDAEREIGLQQWKGIVDECARAKIGNIEMFGGDALLRPDVLFPIIRYATAKGIECDFVTNGLLLDEKAARELVLAGPKAVVVSLDGIGDTYDAVRGVPGGFSKARSALRNTKTARESLSESRGRPQLVVNTTVSRRNVRALEDIVEFVEEEKPDILALEYVGQFSDTAIRKSAVGDVLPDPYFIAQDESSFLSVEDVEFFKEWLQRIRNAGRPRGVTLVAKNMDALSLDQMTSGKLPWKRCYVCRSYVTVDPSGNLLCCPFFSQFHLGNAIREPLSRIWGNATHRSFIRAQTKKEIAICQECILSVERNPRLLEAAKKWGSQHWKWRKYRRKQTCQNE